MKRKKGNKGLEGRSAGDNEVKENDSVLMRKSSGKGISDRERSVCEQRKTLRKSNGQNRGRKTTSILKGKKRERKIKKSERKLKALDFGFRLRLES